MSEPFLEYLKVPTYVAVWFPCLLPVSPVARRLRAKDALKLRNGFYA